MKSLDTTIAAGASFVVLLAGCASAQVGTSPAVPETLKVPASQTLSVSAQAIGVQIYECAASKTDPTRFEWAFRAPEAELFDDAGAKIGKHYAGPTWESNDGSKAVGEAKARDDGPDPNAIPWLLLRAVSTEDPGIFHRVTYIQRLNTTGGLAPTANCDAAHEGQEVGVPYTAEYWFYREHN